MTAQPPQWILTWLTEFENDIEPLKDKDEDSYDDAYNIHLEALHAMVRDWAEETEPDDPDVGSSRM